MHAVISPRRVLLGLCATAVLLLLIAGSALARPTTAQKAGCQQRVAFGVVDVRTTGCLTTLTTTPVSWQTTGSVTLNGLPLPVLPGTRLVLKGPSPTDKGGSLHGYTTLSVAGVKLRTGLLSLKFPAGKPGDPAQTVTTVTPSGGQKLFGLGVDGTATIQMGRESTGDQQGYASVKLIVQLPSIFKMGPSSTSGPLTSEVSIHSDATTGVHLDVLRAQIANAYIGQLLVKNVCLSYLSSAGAGEPCQPPKYGASRLLDCSSATGTGPRWDGSAVVQIPTQDKPDLGLFAGLQSGQLSYAGGQVTGLGKSVPLATGVYLDRFGLGICLTPKPLHLKGTAAIRFGPSVGGYGAAYLDGSMDYIDSSPWVIKATGDLTLFGYSLANGYLTYQSSGAIDFGFGADFSFAGGLFTATGRMSGWYQPGGYTVKLCRALFFAVPCTEAACRQAGLVCADYPVARAFNVYGEAKMCVSVFCASGQAAASTKGVAGCFIFASLPYPYVGGDWYDPSSWYYETRYKDLRAGAGYLWDDGSLSVMGDSCDVGPYQEARVSLASATGLRRVRLAAGQDAVVLRIAGHGRPPKVRVSGPGGRTIVSPAVSGVLRRGKYAIVEDPEDDSTEVLIVKPAAGVWTVGALPGSAPITGITQAAGDVPPQIMAGVRGSGQHRMLGYAYMPERDHTMTFVERGAAYEQQLIAPAGRACRGEPGFARREGWMCGRIDFTPAAGPAGLRRIYALIYDHRGELVREQLIASYRYGGEPRPAKPASLRIRRSGSTATITWSAARGAVDYDLDVYLSNGTRMLDVTGARTRRATLRGIARRLRVTAVVSGLRADGVAGPAARS